MSENDEPLYAFYDKTQEVHNGGWVWLHKDLALDDVRRCCKECIFDKDKDIAGEPAGNQGFVRFGNRTVCYGFYPAGKDDKGRNRWVLVTAWLPIGNKTDEMDFIAGDEVFRQVAAGNYGITGKLSKFDYDAEIVRLVRDGHRVSFVKPSEAEEIRREIKKCCDVEIVFYRINANDAVIETRKKENSV